MPLLVLLFCLAGLLGGCGSSGIDLPVRIYGASLSGSNEVPPVTTLATGTVVMTYNTLANTFDIEVTVPGIAAANVIGWSIHAAPAGLNGPVIVNFASLGGTFLDIGGGTMRATGGNIAFPPAFKSDLDAGSCYLNIQTIAAPAGEVRGQLSSAF
jgi:hypothetical protein